MREYLIEYEEINEAGEIIELLIEFWAEDELHAINQLIGTYWDDECKIFCIVSINVK